MTSQPSIMTHTLTSNWKLQKKKKQKQNPCVSFWEKTFQDHLLPPTFLPFTKPGERLTLRGIVVSFMTETNIKALNRITYEDKEHIYWRVRGQAGICRNLTSRHKFKSSPKLFLVSVKGTGTIIKSPGIC